MFVCCGRFVHEIDIYFFLIWKFVKMVKSFMDAETGNKIPGKLVMDLQGQLTSFVSGKTLQIFTIPGNVLASY